MKIQAVLFTFWRIYAIIKVIVKRIDKFEFDEDLILMKLENAELKPLKLGKRTALITHGTNGSLPNTNTLGATSIFSILS